MGSHVATDFTTAATADGLRAPGPDGFDARAELERIAVALRAQVTDQLKRPGIVVAMSGGVDSSVWAAIEQRTVRLSADVQRDVVAAAARATARYLHTPPLVVEPVLDSAGSDLSHQ